ncbi:MAG TPA: TonB-dependent receptor [Caulobacteraceae bacterium]|nr:TonB-dependent receptor [Caulobacteraceae bacterium]
MAAPATGAAQSAGGAMVAPVVVVSATPLPGSMVDANKLAGEVQTLAVSRLAEGRGPDAIPSLAATQLPSVSLNDEQGSRFQLDFTFRGFEASPIAGVAEGLAVYQNGVRLNEAFGDNVNWDLIPTFAAREVTVQSNNPVFGLNALGGAVTIAMKDGLGFDGSRAELSGGSFGDVASHAELGRRIGDVGFYLAAGGQHDDGFRRRSPATLRQAYADLAYQTGRLTLHVSAAAARNDIDAVGPAPVQLLAVDSRAAFTTPQSMRNEAELIQLRGAYAAGDAVTVSASLYARRFEQHLTDGNTTEVVLCANDPGQLCLEGASQFPADALFDTFGRPVPASVLPAGGTPGEIDFSHTRTTSYGAAIQAAFTAPIASHANSLTLGASIDRGRTGYAAYGELGDLQASLAVAGAGVVIDQALSPTASPPLEAPVDVVADNTYAGLYALDVLDLTPRLSLTLSGRWNAAQIRLRDPTRGALNADHGFRRFNPGAGLAYKVAPALTAYAGYSEASRAPTPGELSCADPASPCLLDAFLVADPPLKEVVARTIEAGLRGRTLAGGGAVTWNVSAFRTESRDDILLLATDINGFGFFQNAGTTLRQGVDASLAYRDRALDVSLGYAYLDAEFRDALTLSSNSPAADASGLIHVGPGDRLPLAPANRVTLSADDDVSPALTLGVDLRWQSGQYLAGDASNQEPPLPGFTTVNIHAVYRVRPGLELFGEVRNLLDAHYGGFGAFTSLDRLPPNVRLTDPRTLSPAEGRAFTLGARWDVP